MVKLSLLTAVVAALPSVFATPVAAPSNSSAPAVLEKRAEGVHLFNCFPTSNSANNWLSVVAYCANDADCSNPSHVLSGSNVCVKKFSLNNNDCESRPCPPAGRASHASDAWGGGGGEDKGWELTPRALFLVNIWEGSEQSCTFSSGVTFSWNIDRNAQRQNDYTYVGSGWNNFRSFAGYKDNKQQGATYLNHDCKKIYYFI
ncbi:hypothetical protein VTJ83DRAFT_6888 [Remersonia thermophila]|uniref:Uncharacterized protein n=1 Tax=Remersonia thermophila TaxID=72144 RepID=A0ABR4D609_9PEZI